MYFETRGFEQVGERRSIGGVPPGSHMERTRGIGGNELQQDALTLSHSAASVARVLVDDAQELFAIRLRREMKVDEAGSGDLHFRNRLARRQGIDDGLGQLPRIAACYLGETHGNVAREVAMQWIARTLDLDRG